MPVFEIGILLLSVVAVALLYTGPTTVFILSLVMLAVNCLVLFRVHRKDAGGADNSPLSSLFFILSIIVCCLMVVGAAREVRERLHNPPTTKGELR